MSLLSTHIKVINMQTLSLPYSFPKSVTLLFAVADLKGDPIRPNWDQRSKGLRYCVKNWPDTDKVPKDVSGLQSFLGMIQYYSRFLRGLATTLAPLHQLLKKDVPWRWIGVEQTAFERCKASLSSDALLVHYDTKRDGLGVIISHVMDVGEEWPITFESRTLTDSERKDAQFEKEALSLVFGV